MVMGSYGIGTGRLLACIAEEHHDERGLRLPVTIAPYQVHLVALAGKSAEVQAAADQLYAQLTSAGIEVLYDDREERAGAKFTDADLIGLPLRVTLSAKTLAKAEIELKRRDEAELTLVPLAEVIPVIGQTLAALHAELAAKVTPVPFRS